MHIERARAEHHTNLLIADHYSTVSLAQFFLPDHPTVYEPTGWHPQFKLWGGYQLTLKTRALFITTNLRDDLEPIGPRLATEFEPPQLVDDFWAQENGRNIKRYRIYLLTPRNQNLPSTNSTTAK
jgi:hypothetical protein